MSKAASQPFDVVTNAVADAALLDVPAGLIGRAVRALRSDSMNNVLSGTWFGHAIHPLLTDVVIGSWTSATVLDLVGGRGSDRAARRLLAVGIAAYAPTAITGLSDWTDSEEVDEEARRVGIVHAVTNSTALACYVASLRSRRAGHRVRGVVLALAGAGALSAAGHLGGHLAFRLGVAVDQTAFDGVPEDWTDVLASYDLVATKPVTVHVADTPVMLVRDGEELIAIHDRCSHRGCSLASGEVEGGAVVCPCHGSRFDLRTGAVLRGPATAPQPVFEARTHAGRIEVRAGGGA